MFKLVSKTSPIRHHLTKITFQLVHKTVLHWLPWIILLFPNPFLTSVLYWLSCDLPQNLSDCYPLFNYLSHHSHFFLIFGFNVQTTDFILFQFMVLKHDGSTYECSKWEHTFSQAAGEKTVIFLGHSDFFCVMPPLLDYKENFCIWAQTWLLRGKEKKQKTFLKVKLSKKRVKTLKMFTFSLVLVRRRNLLGELQVESIPSHTNPFLKWCNSITPSHIVC